MADIPDEFIFGSTEDVMQGECEFDHTEIWPEMPAIFGQNGNQFTADLLGKLMQLRQRQFLDVQGRVNHFEISAHNSRVIQLVQFVRFSRFQGTNTGRIFARLTLMLHTQPRSVAGPNDLKT